MRRVVFLVAAFAAATPSYGFNLPKNMVIDAMVLDRGLGIRDPKLKIIRHDDVNVSELCGGRACESLNGFSALTDCENAFVAEMNFEGAVCRPINLKGTQFNARF